MGAQQQTPAPQPPLAQTADAKARTVLRDKSEAAEQGWEQRPAPGLVLDVLPEPHTIWDDETLSIKTIAACAAVVIAVGFGFVTVLPSLLTSTDQSTVALTPPPAAVPPAQTQPIEAAVPAPAPQPEAAQLRGTAAPSRASNTSTAVAKSAPASNEKLGASSQKQAVDRTIAGSSKAGSTTAGGIALTADENAAVGRGRQALQKATPAAAPRRAASARPPLTAEEKAAIERGLKELAKTAGQPPP